MGHTVQSADHENEKMYQLDLKTEIPVPDDDSLYPYINNDIEYGVFEDIVDSYYLNSQIKDDFQCNQDCYLHQWESTADDHSISCNATRTVIYTNGNLQQMIILSHAHMHMIT